MFKDFWLLHNEPDEVKKTYIEETYIFRFNVVYTMGEIYDLLYVDSIT